MVILIIAIENFPKENYNFNYSISPYLMYSLLQCFPECSLQPFILSYLFEPQQVARSSSYLQALWLTLKPVHHSTAVTESRLEIHLQCALLPHYKQINHLLSFSLKLQSPLKEKDSAYIRSFLELGFITLTRTYHFWLSLLAHSAVDGFPKGQAILSERISVWIEKHVRV